MRRLVPFAVFATALVSAGCGAPDAKDVAKAAREIQATSDAAGTFAQKLDFLHLLPRKHCGEPARDFAARFVPELEVGLGCSGIERAMGESVDELFVRFPDAGCRVGDKDVTGSLLVATNAGDDRTNVLVDLSELRTDGHAVPGRGGYDECGAESSYWAQLEGRLPGKSERRFRLEGGYDRVEGLPLIGFGDHGITADGIVSTGGGDSQVFLRGVVTEVVGQAVPRRGEADIETETGARMRVKFQSQRVDEQVADVELQLEPGSEPYGFSVGLAGDEDGATR